MDEKLREIKEQLTDIVIDELIAYLKSLKTTPKTKRTKAEINAAGIGTTPKLLIERATPIPPQEKIIYKK